MLLTNNELRIHLGPTQLLLIYDNHKLGGVRQLEVNINQDRTVPEVIYTAAELFPTISDDPIPMDVFSNELYPFRAVIKPRCADCLLIYKSRPLGYVRHFYATLSADAKPLVRITVVKMPEELRDELVALGLEIIIEEE